MQEILKSNEACCVICHRPFLPDEKNYITVWGWGAENATLGTTFGIGRKIEKLHSLDDLMLIHKNNLTLIGIHPSRNVSLYYSL